MRDGQWQSVHTVIKITTKLQMCDAFGEVIHRFVEMQAKGEVRDFQWQVVDTLIKVFAKGQMRDAKREFVHELIEIVAKLQMRDALRQVIDAVIKEGIKFEFSHRGRNALNENHIFQLFWFIPQKPDGASFTLLWKPEVI